MIIILRPLLLGSYIPREVLPLFPSAVILNHLLEGETDLPMPHTKVRLYIPQRSGFHAYLFLGDSFFLQLKLSCENLLLQVISYNDATNNDDMIIIAVITKTYVYVYMDTTLKNKKHNGTFEGKEVIP